MVQPVYWYLFLQKLLSKHLTAVPSIISSVGRELGPQHYWTLKLSNLEKIG